MPEKEPLYFKEFRKHIDKRFDEQDKFIVKTVDTAVEDLAVMTKKCFDKLEVRVGNIENDIVDIKSDIAILKTNVTVLKTDVAILKIDVADLKSDVSDLKSDVTRIDDNMKKIEGHIGRYEVRTQKLERTVFV